MSDFLISTGGFILLVLIMYMFFVYEPYTGAPPSSIPSDPGAGYELWTAGLKPDDIQTAIVATAEYLSNELCVYGIETTSIKKYTSGGDNIRYVCSFMFTAKSKNGYPYAFRVDSIVDNGKATSVTRETEERMSDTPDLSYLPYSEIKEFKLNK